MRRQAARRPHPSPNPPWSVPPLSILALSVLLTMPAPAGVQAAPSPDSAPESFELRATERDFDSYYPTYLANGYWSMASSLLGTAPTPAQMIGVMDYTATDVSRPAALPSWNEIDYFDGAQWLNAHPVSRRTHTDYAQTLDMRDGQLDTRYRWRSTAHVTDVAVTSFVSQSDPHLAAVSLLITPRFSGPIRLRFTLRSTPAPRRLPLAEMNAAQFGAAAAAAQRTDLVTGGDRDAIWYLGQVLRTAQGGDLDRNTLWMEGRAIGGRAIALGAAIAVAPNLALPHTTRRQDGDAVTLEVEGRVHSGRAYRFTKFVAASAEGWPGAGSPAERRAGRPGSPRPGELDAAAAARARSAELEALRAAHEAAWHGLWTSDIVVGGNPELQRTIHSDLFYLLENSTPQTSWPASACGFSGNYFGHVFWDNDFWVFPALLLLHPERAQSLIAFRQRTLPEALERARSHGFAGAMYPWEADPASGTDVTPKFAIENAEREIHVNGAVALAQWQYYLASGDREWLRDRAFPVIAAVADFWASRVTYDSAKQRYELLNVMSPEEDYAHVNNEIYTNVVAHGSLLAAVAAARVLGRAPGPRWAEVADALYLPTAGDHGRYDDFDPSTPHDKTTSWMATSVPMLSIPAVGFNPDADTRSGLLQHSLAAISPMRGRANQMILMMLAIQAAQAGDAGYFDDFIGGRDAVDPYLKPPFNVRSETPQNNSVYLLATSGGFIQAFMFGLSGLRIEADGLVERFSPTLPRQLTSLKLVHLTFRGERVDVTLKRLPSGRVVLERSASKADG